MFFCETVKKTKFSHFYRQTEEQQIFHHNYSLIENIWLLFCQSANYFSSNSLKRSRFFSCVQSFWCTGLCSAWCSCYSHFNFKPARLTDARRLVSSRRGSNSSVQFVSVAERDRANPRRLKSVLQHLLFSGRVQRKTKESSDVFQS